jgi:hypothetical protein
MVAAAADEPEYTEYVTARLPALRRLAYVLSGDAHRADGKVIGGQSDDRSGVIRAVVWTCS